MRHVGGFSVAIALALLVTGWARGEESEGEKAIKKAVADLEAAKVAAKTPEDKLRLEMALDAFKKVPAKIKVQDYKEGMSFQEGDVRYTIDMIKKDGHPCTIYFLVKNMSDKREVFRESCMKRLQSVVVTDDDGKSHFSGITEMELGFRPIQPMASGWVKVGFNLKDRNKEVYLTFPETTDHPLLRIVVPYDSLRLK